MRASALSRAVASILPLDTSRSRLPFNVAIPASSAVSCRSTMITFMPAIAIVWAIPLPIVPAPTIPTVSIFITIVLLPCVASRLLKVFEHRGNALPATDAHRHQRVTAVDALQFVERLHGNHRTGRADRMPERNPRAVRIDPGRVELQLLTDSTGLRSEGFVRFDHVEIVDAQTGAL